MINDNVITKDEQGSWFSSYSDEVSKVESLLSKAKLEEDPDSPRFLTTVRGVGYRFDPRGT